MASPQDSLGFLLADVSRLMRFQFRKRLRGSSLTLAQARALIYVSRHEGVRQVVLAEMIEIQPITLARMIDHLAGLGLVERRDDPSDRRAYQLYLTPAAAPHLVAIEKVARQIRAQALRDLDDDEAAIVVRALQKMHKNLSVR